MIQVSIGGFYSHHTGLQILLQLREQRPEWFREDVVFDSTFDSFPNIIWNGGRFRWDRPCPVADMARLIEFYNDRGIGIRYTYTNMLLEKRHLHDTMANRTMDLAHNPLNGVIVANPVLEQYIRERFPKYKLIASCTTNMLDKQALCKRAREVDLVVIPPDRHRKRNLVKAIGPERLEVLVNERCRPMCPDRVAHYRRISKDILDYNTENLTNPNCHLPAGCVYTQDSEAWNTRLKTGKAPLVLDHADVRKLHEMGVNYFKIAGRGLSWEVLLKDIAEHMVREEHQFDFYKEMVLTTQDYNNQSARQASPPA